MKKRFLLSILLAGTAHSLYPQTIHYPQEIKEIYTQADKEAVDHAVKTGGIDHVGIGIDLDGGGGYRCPRSIFQEKQMTYSEKRYIFVR